MSAWASTGIRTSGLFRRHPVGSVGMEYNAVDVTPSLAVLQIADARGGAMGIRRLDAT